jgi:hypothetical protein
LLLVGVPLVGVTPVVASPVLLELVPAVVVAPAVSLARVPPSLQAPRPAPRAIHTGTPAPTRHIRPCRVIGPGDHIGRATGRPTDGALWGGDAP